MWARRTRLTLPRSWRRLGLRCVWSLRSSISMGLSRSCNIMWHLWDWIRRCLGKFKATWNGYLPSTLLGVLLPEYCGECTTIENLFILFSLMVDCFSSLLIGMFVNYCLFCNFLLHFWNNHSFVLVFCNCVVKFAKKYDKNYFKFLYYKRTSITNILVNQFIDLLQCLYIARELGIGIHTKFSHIWPVSFKKLFEFVKK